MPKPYSPAAGRNRDAILEVLHEHLRPDARVLEVGSGTGQHAVHFASALPRVVWQTSDRAENLPGIQEWLTEAGLVNTPPPFAFDVNGTWPQHRYDALFTANTLHIMSWSEVGRLFSGLPQLLEPQARVFVYGPFNYQGHFTSASNAAFDATLRTDHPQRGIRDFEAVARLAEAAGLALVEDHAMPANNRCITWRMA